MDFNLNHFLGNEKCGSPCDDQRRVEKSIEVDVVEIRSTPVEFEIEKNLEEGSIVESLDQVYMLYCEYARLMGFSVKKGTQNYFQKSSEIRMKVYQCSCEGQPNNKRSVGRVAAYKKKVTRTDCKAKLRVARERDGQWTVCRFYKEHNHDLLSPHQSYLLRSTRSMSHAKNSILEALNSPRIGVSRACHYMENESGGIMNVGFTRKDANAHMNRVKSKTKLENVDANALLQFFISKSNSESLFFWKVQMDDEGRLMNFFFCDARSAVDYEYFGDVLSIDFTYRTNKYNLVCVPFVGINHHFNNVMFGSAFLSDETTKSFQWLFATFLESMAGKNPEVVFCDKCRVDKQN